MTPDQKAILALTAENERLRGLLREAKPVTVELVALLQATSKHLPASAPIDMSAAQAAMDDLTGWISRIDAALAGAADQPAVAPCDHQWVAYAYSAGKVVSAACHKCGAERATYPTPAPQPQCACEYYWPGQGHHPDCPTRATNPTSEVQK